MKIIKDSISRVELAELAKEIFGDFVKAVVDIKREVMALGVELHVDAEAALLDDGSAQADLWGINIYPDQTKEDWVEFDSMINLRPAQNNRSRGVEDEGRRQKIKAVVSKLVVN